MKESLPIRTAFLISGRGSTVERVIREWQMGMLPGIEPVVVVSSNEDSQYITKAKDPKNNLPIPTVTVDRERYPKGKAGNEDFGKELLQIFHDYDVRLISQNGWMVITPLNVLREFEWRIPNQHPAKTPEFAGLKAEQAVAATLAYYWATLENPYVTSTVHHTISKVDMGNIISAHNLPVPPRDRIVSVSDLRRDPGELINETHRIYENILLPEERENVIGALRIFAKGNEGEIHGTPPVATIGLGKNEGILFEAIALAKEHF